MGNKQLSIEVTKDEGREAIDEAIETYDDAAKAHAKSTQRITEARESVAEAMRAAKVLSHKGAGRIFTMTDSLKIVRQKEAE